MKEAETQTCPTCGVNYTCGKQHVWINSFGSCQKCQDKAQQEQPAQKPDLWKTQFLTDVMTSAGLLIHGRTDKKLAQRIADGSARWRTELYTHPAPTRPVLSDDEFIAAMDSNGIGPVDPDVAFAIKALVEAHCRGGAK